MLPVKVKPHYAQFWESWTQRISNHSRPKRNLGADGPPAAPPTLVVHVSMVGTDPEKSHNQSVEGKLIEGWDPPAALRHLSMEFKHNICLRARVSAID